MDSREQNFRIAVLLNVTFTILEFVGGILTNSLAILSDSLHDFGDSITLFISWIFERKAKKVPDKRRTFGYQRLSLFSAVFSAMVLIGGSIFILSKAIPKLFSPEPVNAYGMIVMAIIGIISNSIGFYNLRRGESLNEKVLSWHLLEDVLGWITILVGSIIAQLWKAPIIDPILTVGFTIFMLIKVTQSLQEAFNILLQGVPKHIDLEKVKKRLLSIEGVKGVHDVHIWSLEGETDIFSSHIIVEKNLLQKPDETRKVIKDKLKMHHIEHSTIELESEDSCSGIECRDNV